MLDEPDPGRQLDLVATNSQIVRQRAADVMEVVRSGAAADPELAELWQKMHAEFHDNQRNVILALASKGGLRPNLTEDEATDLL